MLDALAIAVRVAVQFQAIVPEEGFTIVIDWKDKTITMETLEWGEQNAVQSEG